MNEAWGLYVGVAGFVYLFGLFFFAVEGASATSPVAVREAKSLLATWAVVGIAVSFAWIPALIVWSWYQLDDTY